MSLFKLSNSLFSVINIGRTFLCLPVYLAPNEVVWYCKIKRAGGAVVSAETRVPGTFPPSLYMETCAV